MKLEEFIGNKREIQCICDWLNEYFHNKSNQTHNYCIIKGSSGNGKSTLPKLLAKEFGVELFIVTPLDSLNINDIIKSINMKTLDSSKYKLILIDDFDGFSKRNQKKLYDIVNFSNHPIIFTCKYVVFSKEFIYDSLKDIKGRIIKINKPLTSELLEYLKSINNKIPIEVLDKIAKESLSVRSAILSMKTQSINSLNKPEETLGDLFRAVTNRKLNRDLDRHDVQRLFSSIDGYNINCLKVRKKFAEFDYRCCCKYETIDSFFINNMVEPIEKVKFEYKSKNNNKKKKRKINNKTIKKETIGKEPEKKKTSINQWI